MEVLKHIKRLLFSEGCVVLPDFGGIITSYCSADIHPVTHRFLPPSKKLAFNEMLRKNDDLLQREIAEKEGISFEKAGEEIRNFIDWIYSEIEKNNFVELKDVGKFYLNPEKKLDFQPDNKVNYLEESYGLPEFVYKPIERKINMSNIQSNRRPIGAVKNRSQREPIKNQENKNDKKMSGIKIAAIIIPVVLVLAGGLFFVTGNDSNGNFLSLGFSSTPEPEEVTKPETVETVEEETVAEEQVEVVAEPEMEAAPAEEKEASALEVAYSGDAGKYSIIVGSFQEEKNAEKLKRRIEGAGNPVVILPANSFYRVSVAEFNDWNSALTNLGSYKSKFNQDAWILENK